MLAKNLLSIMVAVVGVELLATAARGDSPAGSAAAELIDFENAFGDLTTGIFIGLAGPQTIGGVLFIPTPGGMVVNTDESLNGGPSGFTSDSVGLNVSISATLRFPQRVKHVSFECGAMTDWEVGDVFVIQANGVTIRQVALGWGQSTAVNLTIDPPALEITIVPQQPSSWFAMDNLFFAPAVPAPACPQDLTGDGHVDAADLASLLGGWGACP